MDIASNTVSPEHLASDLVARHYWKTRLSNFVISDYLAYFADHENVLSGEMFVTSVPVPATALAKIRTAASTPMAQHLLMLATLGILLQKVSGSSDIAVFTPVTSGGEGAADAHIVPVRMSYKPGETVVEYLGNLKSAVTKDFNSRLSSAEIQKLCMPENAFVGLVGIEIRNLKSWPAEIGGTPDILFSFDFKEESDLKISYSPRYSEQSVRLLASYFFSLFENMIAHKNEALDRIDTMNEQARRRVFENGNAGMTSLAEQRSIIELIENSVSMAPDQIALIQKTNTLTYLQLNNAANQLANGLLERGLAPFSGVGIALPRSIDAIICILACFKIGCHYVYIDPEYPEERIKTIIKDCKLQFSLVAPLSGIVEKELAVQWISYDRQDEVWKQYHSANLNIGLAKTTLAYVIYTSGSTGKPKGAMIDHGALADYALTFRDYFKLTQSDKVIHQASLSFDTSIEEIFPVLIACGQLIIAERGGRDVLDLIETISLNRATVLSTTPLVLKELNGHQAELASVRAIISGGDVLYPQYVDQLLATSEVFNTYGPSEATVCTTYHKIGRLEHASLIGKPIRNRKVFILDADRNLCPERVGGEIYIGGSGLAQGYINNHEQTVNAFLTLENISTERLYKSGDLGRWLPDGSVEFLGRVDHQVKVNGIRVELGEVEITLGSHPDIEACAVVKKGNNLVAFYIADEDITQLFDFLHSRLPHYMIPSDFVRLQALPVNANGKVDRKALEEFDVSHKAHKGPRNETDAKLTEIWASVLGLDAGTINIDEGFFALGGNSILAIIMINKVKGQLGVEVTIKDLFDHKTIEGLSDHLFTERDEGDDEIQFTRLKPAEKKRYYRLTVAQKRVYFMQELDKTSLVFNLSAVLRIRGNLDKQRLSRVFDKLIERHESFRTSFRVIDGEPVQIVSDRLHLPIGTVKANEQEAHEIIRRFIRPFELSEAPLLRVGLIELSAMDHLLMIDMHHIITDGTSIGILTKDFMALYNDQPLPELEITYKDYAEWQNSDSYRKKIEKQREFWVQEFSNELVPLQLPSEEISDDALFNRDERVLTFGLTARETQELTMIANREQATISMIVLSIFKVFLSKITAQEDVVVGMVVAGREQTELENIIGMFPVALPIRSTVSKDLEFKDLLTNIKLKLVEVIDNQNYPYEDLAKELNLNRSSVFNPWFDVLFMYQNFQTGGPLQINDLEISFYTNIHATSQSTLMCVVAEHPDHHISFDLTYTKLSIREGTMKRYIRLFHHIVNEVLKNPSVKLGDIEIITREEKQHILRDINNTDAPLDLHRAFHQIFEDQVNATPGAVAVSHNGEEMSYRALSHRSIQIAKALVAKGARKSDRIAVVTPRSIDMLASILGILRIGAVYAPIDTEFPNERIHEILLDLDPKVLITEGTFELRSDLKHLEVLELASSNLERQSASLDPLHIAPQDPVYVIYTSGTTGKPKGVVIPHIGFINHLYAMIRILGITERDWVGQTAAPSFDISIWQFLVALMVGGRTHIVDKEVQIDTVRLSNEIQKGISIWQTVPSLLSVFLDSIGTGGAPLFPKLRWLIPTGESLNVSLVEEWQSFYPGIPLLNAYGPAEASDDVATYRIEKNRKGMTAIPVGKPIQNTHIYILDADQKLCPPGVKGEIYVSGFGVGIGYLNNEKETRRAFVDNPFYEEIGRDEYKKMYKTGDWGYYTEDGQIVCIGRLDNQVKIRGARIELSEIENQLRSHHAIREAVLVVKKEKSNSYLIAYFTTKAEVDARTLEKYLKDRLPVYMIPSFFIEVDKIPTTLNGKVDKRALPEPQLDTTSDYVAPSGPVEMKLAEIWSSVLGLELEQMSVTSNFFFLGGHSLKAMAITNRVSEEFGYKLSLLDFFNHPTIQELAEFITYNQDELSMEDRIEIVI